MKDVPNIPGHAMSDDLKQALIDSAEEAKRGDTLISAQATREIKSPNAEQHMREGLDAAYAAAEENKRQADFTRRRNDPTYVKYGVDECSATGAGHTPQLQSDGRYYCEYCGAEILPEHVKEWESEE